MRQFVEQTRETKELTQIICNKCGKRIPVIQGVPREDVLSIDKRWGYFSEKDNRIDHFDLCEECYDELTAGFKIRPDNIERCQNCRSV